MGLLGGRGLGLLLGKTQLHLVLPERGEIGAHTDDPAPWRAPLRHAHPLPAGELLFHIAFATMVEFQPARIPILDRSLDNELPAADAFPYDIGEVDARLHHVSDDRAELAILLVPEQKPVVLVPNHDGFRHAADRLRDLLVQVVVPSLRGHPLPRLKRQFEQSSELGHGVSDTRKTQGVPAHRVVA